MEINESPERHGYLVLECFSCLEYVFIMSLETINVQA